MGVVGVWGGREGGLARSCGACGAAASRAETLCHMGQAARMLSSELEMYPMIAVAPEMAMVRTAGSICIAVAATRSRHLAPNFSQGGGKLRTPSPGDPGIAELRSIRAV